MPSAFSLISTENHPVSKEFPANFHVGLRNLPEKTTRRNLFFCHLHNFFKKTVTVASIFGRTYHFRCTSEFSLPFRRGALLNYRALRLARCFTATSSRTFFRNSAKKPGRPVGFGAKFEPPRRAGGETGARVRRHVPFGGGGRSEGVKLVT